MRLVLLIDQKLLHDYQVSRSTEGLDTLFLYVDKLLKKHEIWIICNAIFSEAVRAIRDRLKNLLPQERIQIFHLPFIENTSKDNKNYQRETNQLVYDYFLSQFYPDLLLIIGTKDNASDTDNYRVIPKRQKRKKRDSSTNFNQRPKLAYFSPLPPTKSGIAYYSSELLPYLSNYYDITLINDHKEIETEYGGAVFQALSSDDFLKNPEQFDRTIYHFGNNYYHSYMWPALKKHPGMVILHDFYLSGLFSYEEIINNKGPVWMEQLFKSHGYHAIQERFDTERTNAVPYRYPCNYEVLQRATGVIVHSAYSKRLANQWYDINPLKQWKTIPLLRESAKIINKKHSRKALGFREDELIICSFGLMNPTKLNHLLIEAFLDSKLAKNQNCHLIFIGEIDNEEYALELNSTSLAKDRITITGWVDNETFHQYLQIADIGVQLRTSSRGESSAAVLDCMNYGIATIINANGSMADFPKEAVYMLDDNFDQQDLVNALEHLESNQTLRKNLGKKSRDFIHAYHAPQSCAFEYKEAIENTHQNHTNYTKLICSIASINELRDKPEELDIVTNSISQSILPAIRQKQLLVDVSAIVQTDHRTGIQRVVRALLLELFKNTPPSIRVEPVYLSMEGEIHYRYARRYTRELLDIPIEIEEKTVDVSNGDIFYGLDFYNDGVIQATNEGLYTKWSSLGVTINFEVYDLLPVQYPDFFPERTDILHSQWLKAIISVSDRLICISQTVADTLENWISIHMQPDPYRDLQISAVHLGSDIKASSPSDGLPDTSKEILHKISLYPTFLMVGTIEPRKGHLQTLAAFEALWEKGIDINLIIVGHEGWKGLPDSKRRTIPDIINKLRNHPKLNKNLFFLEGISDIFLEKLYRTSSALIASSEDEGFGLPLIEAAHHSLAVIARDIPIFKEVASDNAFYFPNTKEPLDLADAISRWLEAYHKHNHISSDSMTYITWEENAKQTIETLLHIDKKSQKSTNKTMDNDAGKDQSLTAERTGSDIVRLNSRSTEIYHNLTQMTNTKENHSAYSY